MLEQPPVSEEGGNEYPGYGYGASSPMSAARRLEPCAGGVDPGRKCVSDVAAEEAGRTCAVSVHAIRAVSHLSVATGVADSLRRRSASGRAR